MSKYDEVMNKIELTEERKERILTGIRSKLEGVEDVPMKANRAKRIPMWMPVAATAAVVLLALLIFLGSPLRPGKEPLAPGPTSNPTTEPIASPTPTQGGDTQDWDIYEEVGSREELEEIYGYSIRELKRLPFELNGERYYRYGARPMIIYLGEALGDIDYDGVTDYRELSLFQVKEEKNCIVIDTEYTMDQMLRLENISVRMRGDEEGVQVIEWYDGEFYYMILDDGYMSMEEAIDLVTNFWKP